MKKIALILTSLLVLALAAVSANAQVILDHVDSTTNGNTLSKFAINTANTNRMLVVALATDDNATGVTFGGDNLTFLFEGTNNDGSKNLEIYYMLNPATASGDIVVSGGSFIARTNFSAFSLYDAAQIAPLTTYETADVSSGTEVTYTVPVTSEGSFLLDVVGAFGGSAVSNEGTSTTEFSGNYTGIAAGSSYSEDASIGNYDFIWTSGNGQPGHIGVEVIAIPEPSAFTLLAGGIAALALMRRRRRA